MGKIVCIVAPVHMFDDIRIYKKEAISLANAGYKVILYSRTPTNKGIIEHNIQVKPVIYKNRAIRFLKLTPLFFRILREKADIYHLHNPDTIFYVFILRFIGKKVIYDTHEDFSKKILLRSWIPKLLRRPLALLVLNLEKFVGIITSSMIVTQNEQLTSYSNSFVIGNAPIFKEYELALRNVSEIKLVYLGGISADRGLWKMLEITLSTISINNIPVSLCYKNSS